MNILYTVFAFKVGGIEKLLVDIVNNMNVKSEDKIFLCIINDIYDKELVRMINPNVEIKFLRRKKSDKNLKCLIDYTKFVLKNNIDVIHCQHNNCVKFSILCKLVRPGIKIIHTVHSTQLYIKYKKLDVLIDKFFSDKIIAISESVQNEIMTRGLNNKTVLLYNAIKTSKFKEVKKERNHSDFIIGNVARIDPNHKGQDILLKAIKIVKSKYGNVKCCFAGECAMGKDKYLEDLTALAEQEKIDDSVEFLGNVMDVPKFLSKIDLFVLPSRFEGFGISLIEAMAAEVPVIASDIDGPKEIIGNNEYGLLFKNEDYEDLADKICFAIENRDKIDTGKISDYINDKFDIRTMTNRLYELYKN